MRVAMTGLVAWPEFRDVGDAARHAIIGPAVSWCAAEALVAEVPGIQAEAG
jgi:hypothetical protein